MSSRYITLTQNPGKKIADVNENIENIKDDINNIKPKLYIFGDNLTWSKSAKFKLGAFGSSTVNGPYSDPILPEMISEYLIGEPINNFYELKNPVGYGFSNINIGPKLYNNNNFTIAPGGGFILEYIKSKAVSEALVGTFVTTGINYSMNVNLDDLKSSGKKINSNDYVFISSIFMDLVVLGMVMYGGDFFDMSDPNNPVLKSPDASGLAVDKLLTYYNIPLEGNREKKYERAVQLIAEEYIKFVNRLKSEGAKKIIFFLYKQESLQQMPVISNGNKPADFPPFGIAPLPGKAAVFDKQAEFFDKKIREAFANDPNVYVYDYDITKIIEDAGNYFDGTPVFLNTKTEIMLNNELNIPNSYPYGIVPTIDAINAKLELGEPYTQSTNGVITYNSGTPPEGSNVYNSVWYTGEHTTAAFNVHVAEDLVGKVRDYFEINHNITPEN